MKNGYIVIEEANKSLKKREIQKEKRNTGLGVFRGEHGNMSNKQICLKQRQC